jgi:hypothetical protein
MSPRKRFWYLVAAVLSWLAAIAWAWTDLIDWLT